MPGTEPTGNTAELINNVFEANTKAINIMSSAIGAIADVAGAVGGVISIIDTVVNLLSPASDPLQPILDEIQRDFAQLFAVLKARFDEQDWKDLAKLTSQAQGVAQILDGLVHAQPPPTEVERLGHIATCLDPLNALSDDTGPHPPSPFFLADFLEQVYWTDAGQFLTPVFRSGVPAFNVDVGYGTQTPPRPPDNQVFAYVYVLPFYLKAAAVLVAVGTALFADFGKSAQRQQDAIIKFSKFLTTIHDLIAGDISKLMPELLPRPHGWGDQLLQHSQNLNDPRGISGIGGTFDHVVPPKLTGLRFEFGAVEKFSGCSSIRSAEYNFEPQGPVHADSIIFQKLQVRVSGEMMKVYAKAGLPLVWNAINDLNRLAGQPLLPRHRLARWSFREILDQAGVGPRNDGFFHLLDLANSIRQTPPIDTPQTGEVSCRRLLEPA